MSRTRWVHTALLVLVTLLLAGAVWAAGSAGSAVDWQVLDGAGAPAAAGVVMLKGSLGQLAIGPSAAGDTSLGAGFWYGLGAGEQLYRIYLPLVLR